MFLTRLKEDLTSRFFPQKGEEEEGNEGEEKNKLFPQVVWFCYFSMKVKVFFSV